MSREMNAATFEGPYKIVVQKRPKPVIRESTDAIIKVSATGICGSDLHMYRGAQKTLTGHIMGHETVGTVESIGTAVSNVKVGDRVICIFSPSCMRCWYCVRGYTSRCVDGPAFGNQALEGSHADYLRVPYANATLVLAPEDMDDKLLIMMCDIFPTGFYGASRAIDGFMKPYHSGDASEFQNPSLSDAVFVCIGCGPVGLCAILTAKAKGVKTLYAVDSVKDRLADAQRFGAIPLSLNEDDVKKTVMDATDGRGADAVIEVVGNRAALRSAFDLLRPCGILSSIGFNQGEIPWTAFDSYMKNITVNFGRAPVKAVFKDSLDCLRQCKDQLEGFVSHELPLSEAAYGYSIFDKQEAKKVILRPEHS